MSSSRSSLAALPAFYIVFFSAHIYAHSILGKVDPKAYNNANPRASTNVATFSKALGPQGYAKFERARAAHNNGHESFPLFAATVLALKYVGWPEDGLTGVNALAWGNVAARLAYTVLFINTESKRKSYWRTVVWAVPTVVNIAALFAAARM